MHSHDVDSSLETDSGPWRDGPRMVVDLEEPNLPDRCFVTGERNDLRDLTLRHQQFKKPVWLLGALGAILVFLLIHNEYINQWIGLILIFGVFFTLKMIPSTQIRASISVPHSADSVRPPQEFTNFRNREHRKLVLVICGLAIAWLLYLLAMTLLPFAELPQVVNAAMLFVTVAAIGYLVVIAIKYRFKAPDSSTAYDLGIIDVRGRYAWILGVSERVLEDLPSWKNRKP